MSAPESSLRDLAIRIWKAGVQAVDEDVHLRLRAIARVIDELDGRPQVICEAIVAVEEDF